MIKCKVFQVRSSVSSLTTSTLSSEQIISEAITKSLSKGKIPIEVVQSSAFTVNSMGGGVINTHITIFYRDGTKSKQPPLKCQIFAVKGNVSISATIKSLPTHEITDFLSDHKGIAKVIQSSTAVQLPLGGSTIVTHLTVFYY